jgi:hypothetical protein
MTPLPAVVMHETLETEAFTWRTAFPEKPVPEAVQPEAMLLTSAPTEPTISCGFVAYTDPVNDADAGYSESWLMTSAVSVVVVSLLFASYVVLCSTPCAGRVAVFSRMDAGMLARGFGIGWRV